MTQFESTLRTLTNNELLINTMIELSSVKSCRIISLKEYENTHDEISDYKTLFNFKYTNVCLKDKTKLENHKSTSDLEETCRQELLESIEQKLTNGVSDSYTKKDYYTELSNNIKYHVNEDNTISFYINSLVLKKNVLKQGNYKEVKHREKTIVKNSLKKKLELRREKFREFEINESKLKGIIVNKNKIEFSF
jgi:hypothetical protein